MESEHNLPPLIIRFLISTGALLATLHDFSASATTPDQPHSDLAEAIHLDHY